MEFTIETKERNEMIDITEEVSQHVPQGSGLLNVFTPHATAAIIINENDDPNICDDFLQHLSSTIPRGVWRHDKIDGNGDAHIKAGILSPQETIPFKNGLLQLGKWQAIMLVELDGPRKRKVIISVLKG